MKILAIDHKQDNLTTLKAVLADRLTEARLLTALSGTQGIELARAEDPDVILLDIVMPGMDGYTVCRTLRADERTRSIPVLFLTSLRTDRESRVKALEAGAEGFLTKPFDEVELTTQIRTMTKIKAANRMQRLEKEELAALVSERTQALAEELEARKQAEAALWESERKHRHLLLNLNVGVVVHAPDTQILLHNQTAATLLGLSDEQMRGRTAMDPAWCFVSETGQSLPLAGYPVMQVLASRAPLRNFVLGVDHPENGGRTWVLIEAYPEFDEQQQLREVVVTFVDITQRKRAEENVRLITERLNLALTSARAGVWDWNLKTNEMIWDNRMLELYGLTRENFPGGVEAWEQGLHPDDSAKAIEDCQATLRGERDFDTEFRVRRPDGTMIHIKANGLVERDEEGNPVRMIGLNTDITEHKQTEERIAILGRMLDVAPAAITIHDTDGRFIFANVESVSLHGYDSIEEFLQVNLHELDVPESEVLLSERFRKIAQEGETRFEVEHYRKDGSIFPLAILAKRIEWEGRPAVLSIATDITKRKHAEARLTEQLDELQRWQAATLGREGRVQELKREINRLLVAAGQAVRYASVEGV